MIEGKISSFIGKKRETISALDKVKYGMISNIETIKGKK